MAAKCDVCGSMVKKYKTTIHGDICCDACSNAYRLESYLLTMEERREKDEQNNKKAYEQARECPHGYHYIGMEIAMRRNLLANT